MLGGRTHPLLLGPVPGFLFEVDVPLGERACRRHYLTIDVSRKQLKLG